MAYVKCFKNFFNHGVINDISFCDGIKPITTNRNFLWGASGLQPALYSLRPKTIRHQHKDTDNKFNGQTNSMTICRGSLCSKSLGHHNKDTHNDLHGQIKWVTICHGPNIKAPIQDTNNL